MRNAADTRILAQLKEFLFEFNQRGYAAEGQYNRTKEADGSTSIRWEAGPRKGHDNFFGGGPFGGRFVAHLHGRPFWMMVYYGRIHEGRDQNRIFTVLREALRQMPRHRPLRGPSEWFTRPYAYRYRSEGDVGAFYLDESIAEGAVLAYHARFIGGLVDQQ